MSRLKVLIAAAALAASACSGDDTIAPTPTPTQLSDVFPGTLSRNSAASHSFAVAQSGSVAATITALAPDSTLVLGLSLGTWNGSACQVVIDNNNATLNTQVVGTASSSGSLCVRIYDVGNITDPITYEILVVHF